MSIIIPANSAVAGGFDVANSCNFEEGSLHKSVSSPSTTFTISIWVKLTNQYVGSSSIGQRYFWSGGGAGGASGAKWNSGNNGILDFYNEGTGHVNDGTGRNYRDPSAWYHWVWKNSGGTGTLYVNGVQQGSTFSMGPLIGSGGPDVINIGRYGADTVYSPLTMAEFVYLDGTGATPSSFGETDDDTGIWKPKSVSGLTFGTNGFYLDFQDSSNLGNDANGGTDLTKTGTLVQQTDTCTNNFCTINALDNFYEAGTLAEGNLKYTANTGNSTFITSTFGVGNGRWYYEVLCSTEGSNSYKTVGFTPTPSTATNNWFGEDADHVSYYNNGKIYNNGSGTNYGNSWSANDILGCYLDLTSNKAYFSKNGVLQNSGTGYDISGAAFDTSPFWFFTVGMPAAQSPGTVLEANFGNPTFAISSGNTDDNGYGNFEYSPNITGDGAAKSFYAICTKNLAEYG